MLGAITWGLAMAGLVITLGLRLSHLDERWLPAVRLASFTTPIQLAALLPWATTALLAALHLWPNPFSAWQIWILSVTIALAAYSTSPFSPRSRPAGNTGPELLLGSLNVERDTPLAAEIGTRLRELDLDVLLIQEYTPSTAAAFRSSGLLASYPHRSEDPEEGWFGAAIFSRHPIVKSHRRNFGQRPMTVTTLDIDDHPVTVVNVHVQAPIHPRDVQPWRSAFAELAEVAASTAGTIVLSGDWNATLSHQPLHRLLRDGTIIDAHLASRRRAARTWPADRRHPPLLGLDHILLSATVDVRATHEITLPGTDHRAVTASLRLY